MEGKEGYQSRVSLTVRCGSRINQAKASRHLTSQTLMRLRSDHRCKKKRDTNKEKLMACFLQEGHTNESNNIRMRGMKLCIIDDDLRKLI